jgi:Calcineurin-like phosphoesterase
MGALSGSRAVPFAQPPPVLAMTRALGACARRSAVALQQFWPSDPFSPARRTRSAAICSAVSDLGVAGDCRCSEEGVSNQCETDPLVARLVDALKDLLVLPAYADTNKSRSETSTEGSAKEIISQELAVRHPAVERIVAIGDVHGDYTAFRRSLLAAGVIDEDDEWTGGKTVLVQVGDQLDRGDDETSIYETLFKLQDMAPQSGGAVHILLGNHELMNIEMDFRYVTDGGFADFERPTGMRVPVIRKARLPGPLANIIKRLPAPQRARARALSPGGPLAVELARRAQVAVIIGDNVFVHGGLAPRHLTNGGFTGDSPIQSLEAMNLDCRNYMMGKGPRPKILRGGKSPVWMRDYSAPNVFPGSETCRMLADTLKMINVRRMIVGHTPQEYGINAACSGRVWRIDTGMSSAYGGIPEALEISKRGRIRVFSADGGVIQGSARVR